MLYSLDSNASLIRVSGCDIVADTSYLIGLINPSSDSHQVIDAFHQGALSAGASFFINVTARYELMRWIRKGQLVAAIDSLRAADPARFPRPDNDPEAILKSFIRTGDYPAILSQMTVDTYAELSKFELQLGLTYMTGTTSTGWDDLSALMIETGLEPADAMILNFAHYIEADAVVTKDIGFALGANRMDVYMPIAVARRCSTLYDATKDAAV